MKYNEFETGLKAAIFDISSYIKENWGARAEYGDLMASVKFEITRTQESLCEDPNKAESETRTLKLSDVCLDDDSRGAVDYYFDFLTFLSLYYHELCFIFVKCADEIVINHLMKDCSEQETLYAAKRLSNYALSFGAMSAALYEEQSSTDTKPKENKSYPAIMDEMKLFFADTIPVDYITKVGDEEFHHDKEVNVDKEMLFHYLYDFTRDWDNMKEPDTITRWRCLYNELENNNLVRGCKVSKNLKGSPVVDGRPKIKGFVEIVMTYCLSLNDSQQKNLRVSVGHAKAERVSNKSDIEQFVKMVLNKINPVINIFP